jgi:predicted dehydrogenase
MAIRWAVVGATGMIGRRVVPQIAAARNCELVAVQSLDQEALAATTEKYGVPGFESPEEMLDGVRCDVAYLCTPQNVHLEGTRLAAGRGVDVFCEKPLARTGREAREMVDACRQNGVKLGTAFNLRFSAVHIKARQLVQDGAIGKVVSARCQYGQNYPPDPKAFRQKVALSGGGSMVDMGNHAMDLVEFVSGKRFCRVQAIARNIVHSYEVEDALAAILEFEDGGFALVDTYFCVPLNLLRNDLEVSGTKGILFTIDSLRGMTDGGRLVVLTNEGRSEYEWDGTDMYRAEIEAFAGAVLEGRDPPCDGLAGLHSQQLLDACYESSRTGKSVEVARWNE